MIVESATFNNTKHYSCTNLGVVTMKKNTLNYFINTLYFK